jgi:hypothetical protein
VNPLLEAAADAWAAWDAAPARRDRVEQLEAALRPIAERLLMSPSQLRDAVTLSRRNGMDAAAAIAYVLEESLFGDDGRPSTVEVPVGEYL